MGGSQSAPRKVTVENPDETAIKITENVVDRLQGATKSENSDGRETATTSASSSQPPTGAEVVFVTSQSIRREVEKELAENDAYWEGRMRILREGYRKISADLEEEYKKAINKVDSSLGKNLVEGKAGDATASCKASQASVIQCYDRNKDQPLLCASEVEKFNSCVSNCTSPVVRAK